MSGQAARMTSCGNRSERRGLRDSKLRPNQIDLGLDALELRAICTEPDDYANPIEPSGQGRAQDRPRDRSRRRGRECCWCEGDTALGKVLIPDATITGSSNGP